MFSRAQTLLVIAALAAVAVLCMVPAASARPGRSGAPSAPQETSRVVSLRHSIVAHRAATWRFQDLMGVPHTRASHVVGRSRSVPFLRWANGLWNNRQKVARRNLAELRRSTSPSVVPRLICVVFGPAECSEGRRIAWGESRDETWAANGQYLGLFQLGSGERASYATIGYSSAYQQIVAAHNLYRARGWEPWTCCGE